MCQIWTKIHKVRQNRFVIGFKNDSQTWDLWPTEIVIALAFHVIITSFHTWKARTMIFNCEPRFRFQFEISNNSKWELWRECKLPSYKKKINRPLQIERDIIFNLLANNCHHELENKEFYISRVWNSDNNCEIETIFFLAQVHQYSRYLDSLIKKYLGNN